MGSLQRFSRLKFSQLSASSSCRVIFWKQFNSSYVFFVLVLNCMYSSSQTYYKSVMFCLHLHPKLSLKASFSRILKFIWWFSWSWINLECSVLPRFVFRELEEYLDLEMVKCCRLDQLIVACRASSAHLHTHPKTWACNCCLLVFYTNMDNIY